MPHQPPVPEASTSPYPLQPAPIPEEVKQAAEAAAETVETPDEAPAATADAASDGLSARVISLGAAIGLGAAAAVTGLIYSRRRQQDTAAAPKRAASAKRPAKRAAPAKRSPATRRSAASGAAASGPYDVSYFARKHAISTDEARSIIAKAGADRDAANAMAKRRKAK